MDYSYLPAGGAFSESGSEYQMTCPDCGGGNFYWNLQKHLGYCFNCRLSARGMSWFSRVFNLQVVPEVTARTALPAEKKSRRLVHMDHEDAYQGILYLASRGVDYGQALTSGIRYSPEESRIYCPIWSPIKGKPISWKSRSILPGQKGWMGEAGDKQKYYLFGKSTGFGDTVVLVEGVFDVLSPGMWGVALSLLGSSLSKEIEYWVTDNFRNVLLWLDPDQTGVSKSREIETRLWSWGMSVQNLSGKHPEPGSCTVEEARSILGRYTPCLG